MQKSSPLFSAGPSPHTAPQFSWPFPCTAPFWLLSYRTWSVGTILLLLLPHLEEIQQMAFSSVAHGSDSLYWISSLADLGQTFLMLKGLPQACISGLIFPPLHPPTMQPISCCYLASVPLSGSVCLCQQCIHAPHKSVDFLLVSGYAQLGTKPPAEFQPPNHKLSLKTCLSPCPSNEDET